MSTPLPAIANEATEAAIFFDGAGVPSAASFLTWFAEVARFGGNVTAHNLGKASDLVAIFAAVGANQAISEGSPVLVA